MAFLSHNTEVTVEAVENTEHVHEKDDDYDKTNSKYYKWSKEMTEECEKNLEKKP